MLLLEHVSWEVLLSVSVLLDTLMGKFTVEAALQALPYKRERRTADLCADEILKASIWSSTVLSLTEFFSFWAPFGRFLCAKSEAVA